jgi:hypothetical protein
MVWGESVLVSQTIARGNGDSSAVDFLLHVFHAPCILRRSRDTAGYISLLDELQGEAYRYFLWEELTPRGNVVYQGTER